MKRPKKVSTPLASAMPQQSQQHALCTDCHTSRSSVWLSASIKIYIVASGKLRVRCKEFVASAVLPPLDARKLHCCRYRANAGMPGYLRFIPNLILFESNVGSVIGSGLVSPTYFVRVRYLCPPPRLLVRLGPRQGGARQCSPAEFTCSLPMWSRFTSVGDGRPCFHGFASPGQMALQLRAARHCRSRR